MAKKKASSAAALEAMNNDFFSGDALEAMRDYRDSKRDKDGLDGLAVAFIFVAALGLELPGWARNRFIRMQGLMLIAGGTHRQNKLFRKIVTFSKDLMRYVCVVGCDQDKNPHRYVGKETFLKILSGQKLNRRESAQFMRPPAKRNHGRRSNLFEDAFERMEGCMFAPKDSSGVRQSYYRILRMFGSKRLAEYVAVRVVKALISHSQVL